MLASREDFESITQYFYIRAREFRIKSFSSDHDCSKASMCIDTRDELQRIERLYDNEGARIFDLGWNEILPLLQRSDHGVVERH